MNRAADMGKTKTADRADIDTSTPFKSVKEAVAIFRQRVLAEELSASPPKLKAIRANRTGTVRALMEEAKHDLIKSKERSIELANFLSSLQEELERTKLELQRLKICTSDQSRNQLKEAAIEDVKILEDSDKFEAKIQTLKKQEEARKGIEFQKKRCVSFARSPSLAQGVITDGIGLGKHSPPFRTKMKKRNRHRLVLVIRRMFNKN